LTLGEIYAILDEISPFELQEEWDNSGLLLGSMEDEFSRIVLSLDIDEDIINNAENNTLIITHHPLIFGKLGRLDFLKYPAKYLKAMIKRIFPISPCIQTLTKHTLTDMSHVRL